MKYESKPYQWYILAKYQCCKILWKLKCFYRKFFPEKKKPFFGWTEIGFAVLDTRMLAIGVVDKEGITDKKPVYCKDCSKRYRCDSEMNKNCTEVKSYTYEKNNKQNR